MIQSKNSWGDASPCYIHPIPVFFPFFTHPSDRLSLLPLLPLPSQAPLELVKEVAATGRLPVVNFAAGGVATPADAALMMQLGMDGVFVGSGIFKSTDPAKRARAIVQAVTHYRNAEVSRKGKERRERDTHTETHTRPDFLSLLPSLSLSPLPSLGFG